MKVQLIVVQGKPEGKVIPLAGPVFRIGRGETCHLRPNSEQVSREHAEFTLSGDSVAVRDLGSRNGTLVNGKAITEACALKDRDLVQVGPLTFAVSIVGAPAPAAKAAAPAKPASPDDVTHDEIDSWLVADNNNPTPERPSGVYGGDTMTISAFKGEGAANPEPSKPVAAAAKPEPAKPVAAAAKSAPTPVAPAAKSSASIFPEDDEYERLPEGEGDPEEEMDASSEDDTLDDGVPEEFIDESNPFYVKKKAPEAPTKPVYKDTSDAASDILRKMMERRRSSK